MQLFGHRNQLQRLQPSIRQTWHHVGLCANVSEVCDQRGTKRQSSTHCFHVCLSFFLDVRSQHTYDSAEWEYRFLSTYSTTPFWLSCRSLCDQLLHAHCLQSLISSRKDFLRRFLSAMNFRVFNLSAFFRFLSHGFPVSFKEKNDPLSTRRSATWRDSFLIHRGQLSFPLLVAPKNGLSVQVLFMCVPLTGQISQSI